MTSPPYWGLRSYGTDPQIWGGNDCEHEWGDSIDREHFTSDNKDFNARYSGIAPTKNIQQGSTETIKNPNLVKDRIKKQEGGGRSDGGNSGNICRVCGAWKGELGLEPTPEMFISHLADVFDEIKRVLRKDGTLWVNLGDTYISGKGRYKSTAHTISGKGRDEPTANKVDLGKVKDLWYQDKQLALIPSRFAIEMQNRGWILRNDVIWQKPNPMPSSVKDRMTNSYEHLFFFVKNKKYWYDSDAIREEFADSYLNDGRHKTGNKGFGLKHNWEEVKAQDPSGPHRMYDQELNPLGRNALDVWNIATEPLPDEHYAAYPQKLCERPIKAGCPKDGTVLDPFCGSGTTLLVARRLGRKSIGIDLKYQEIALRRLNVDQQRINL